jgi:O-antigen ligase
VSGTLALCVDIKMPQSMPIASHAIGQHYSSKRDVAKRRTLQLIPLLLVFYSFMVLPPEVEVSVFGVNLPSYRIALLLVAVPALWKSLREGVAAIQLMDVAIMIIGFWIMLSFIVNYGFESGSVRGAGITIDTVLPYFVARTCIKSLDDLRYFLIFCLPGLAFAGLVLTLESLSGRHILRPAFAAVFGSMDAFEGGFASGTLSNASEFRLGLMRAYGPFGHPILAGIMMISFLPLYYFSGLRSWPMICGVLIALTGFFSLSSAAFLALIVAILIILIYHVKAYLPKINWWTISGLLLMMVWVLHMLSKNGIIWVIARLTLTPHTAQYRVTIWEFGSVSVAKHPLFGIGYKQWERLSWMGESVDAHFLLLAMRHGLMVPIVMLAGALYCIIRLGMIIPFLSPKDRTFAIGINICVIIFLIVGQTVNYFGSANILFAMMLAFLASTVSWGNRVIAASKRLQRTYWTAPHGGTNTGAIGRRTDSPANV